MPDDMERAKSLQGKRVRLSEAGRAVLRGDRRCVGLVVGTSYSGGCVRVKWEDLKDRETISMCFIEEAPDA